MGEVYRARDMKLDREVALKVLPEGFVADPERVARFHREAQLLASLNHPNVAAIHGLEESDGVRALVLELVDGPTLADRIAQGQIPLDEALPIARQIAEALEAAHEKGVIHRDLKPANIKVTSDGKVKVLDFGLAKMLEAGGAGEAGGTGKARGDGAKGFSPANLSNSPTLSLQATMGGIILGTAAYMSPEQASGKPADKRADIWAFGVVLWEMLTGKTLFEGETISHTLAFVITKEPDWNALPARTPPSILRLLRRCLEKDRRRRLPDIGSAQLEIDDALTVGSVDARAASGATASSSPGWRPALPWVVIVAAAVALAAAVVKWSPWRKNVAPSAVRLSTEIGADASLEVAGAPGSNLALSPNGELLAFVAQKTSGGAAQLHIRRLEQLQATALSGTENARDPFFSPDGQWVAFFADGKLKKTSVAGGAAVTLCEAPNGRGGTWAEDGTIAFTPNSNPGEGLRRVSSAGGKVESLTKLGQDESLHRWPQMLKGGKAVLFSAAANPGNFDDAYIVVQTLPEGARKIIQRGAYFGRYLPSGHLVYMHSGTLFAAPFDLDRMELTGQPVPVVEGVASSVGTGGAQFAVSANGTMVFLPGRDASSDVPIVWMDREGATTPLRSSIAAWSNPHFAPDGSRLAMDTVTTGGLDVWTYEWSRDTLTRLTFDPGTDVKPVWTPDGRRIVFSSSRGGTPAANLFWQRADGTGDVQRLTDSTSNQFAGSWHPSGKFLAFMEQNPQNGPDIMVLPMEGDEASGWKPGKPTVFLSSSFSEFEPMFSPDGRWLAYHSNESGRNEVYVRPFPGPGGKWQISTDGGVYATWSHVRPELFFGGANQQIMVASYRVEGDSFRADKPRAWSQGRYVIRPRFRSFDMHPDGNRFAMAVPETQMGQKRDKVVFIFNFFDELRRLAPAKR
jgi:serine/threonine-protein kinase